ncbi:MAG: hypothetical protein M1834_009143 [Cirrosporium novae-zelandiae]|nr:MAG: hypothetical protein M1834_009143 [Cirrosporium novae-zelandiae]
MSTYYAEPQHWQAPARQASWEGQTPPSRSGTSSTVQQREEPTAFQSQFEEVDRAVDNMVKSGKVFVPGPGPGRRDSMPPMVSPRPFSEYGVYPQRHSISEFDAMRSHSASNLQGYYASQRFQGRPSDEHMMQQKRRMAAQRERELRNFHQEQQYNRSLLAEMSNKSDRSLSPAALSEEGRRELIARQHRALYGGTDGPSGYYAPGYDGQTPRPDSQSANIPTSGPGARGPSPRTAFDAFNSQAGNGEPAPQFAPSEQGSTQQGNVPGSNAPSNQQQRSRANSNSSPSSNNNVFGSQNQQSRTSASSPGESPPRQATKTATAPIGSGVAPIGTRPSQGQAPNPALSKRATTPLPSPLGPGLGFGPNDLASSNNQRSNSSASNAPNAQNGNKQDSSSNVGLGWSNSGVWGTKGTLGVQASVWG